MIDIRDIYDNEMMKALTDLEGARNMQVKADAILTLKMVQEAAEKHERIMAFRLDVDKKLRDKE